MSINDKLILLELNIINFVPAQIAGDVAVQIAGDVAVQIAGDVAVRIFLRSDYQEKVAIARLIEYDVMKDPITIAIHQG